MILFIDGSITPYQITRYNALKKHLGYPIQVWFQELTEKYRDWDRFEDINFDYEVLKVRRIQILGQDVLTLRINTDVIKKLNTLKSKLNRIVITGWDQPICLVAAVWAKFNGIKLTLRAGSTAQQQTWLRTSTFPYVKWFVSLFDDYLAYGSASADYLVSLGAPKNKILKYYNTVDVDFFKSKAKQKTKVRRSLRQKLNIDQSGFVILASGRFVPLKQFEYLIKTFKKFQKHHQNSHLIIMGDGPEMAKCKATAGNLLEHKIHLPGFVQHQDIADYYQAADIFVLSSTSEVWGLVINEAMLSGLPVLVTNVAGCVPELVEEGETGYTFNPSSESSLLDSLNKMYGLFNKKKEFATMQKECILKASQFTNQANVSNLKKFWKLGNAKK